MEKEIHGGIKADEIYIIGSSTFPEKSWFDSRVFVPKEPTREMIARANKKMKFMLSEHDLVAIYKAMIDE